eukprot:COSAG05_NODE_9203_length_640_cov_0.857671_2_plen_22_part_01
MILCRRLGNQCSFSKSTVGIPR